MVSYRKIAQVLFLDMRIRIDLPTAVAFLTSRVANAKQGDNVKLLRILKHLHVTQEVVSIWNGSQGIALEVFADASHAVHDDAEGHSGAVASIRSSSRLS